MHKIKMQPLMIRATAFVIAGAAASWLAFAGGAAQAATYTMKISVPTIHDIPNEWIAGFSAAIEKNSGGQIKTHVYPASQLGSIPRQIEGTQFGSIQCQLIPPEFMVGLDSRFQVLAAPGLIASEKQAQRLAADPSVRKLMLGLGADRGLHGIGLFYAEVDELISRVPLRTLDDLKNKKIRIFASPFQTVAFQRLGMTPVAMTLGDVVPGLQEGTIDSAITGIGPIVAFHMVDAAKYVTRIKQPAIFLIVELNRKWYESLPKNLQQVIEQAAAKEDEAINPIADKMVAEALQKFKTQGGTLYEFSPADQAKLMKIVSDVGAEVAGKNPALDAAYKTVKEAAETVSASK
jgi:TRAP-type transport system periplasmic protein